MIPSVEAVVWQTDVFGQVANDIFLAEFADQTEVSTHEGLDYPSWRMNVREYHDDRLNDGPEWLIDPVQMCEDALERAGYTVIWSNGVYVYRTEDLPETESCEI